MILKFSNTLYLEFMKYQCLSLIIILFIPFILTGQYEFTPEVQVACSDVKSQGNTGTCWSFSTISFLESELLRINQKPQDLSEMFIVRNTYQDKAQNYILRQGKANYSEGSLSHDVMRAYKKHGIVPEYVYSGKVHADSIHDHRKLVRNTKKVLDKWMKDKNKTTSWREQYEVTLSEYLEETPEDFVYLDKQYTPASFASTLGINPDDYVTLSSYTHHPFYESFILEIPDNYSNGSYINIPMDELMSVIDHALESGYTIAWDGDVSEKSFSARSGIAILPVDVKRKDLFDEPGKELEVTQELRQETFENYSTTDDHLMHLVGIAKDQNGTKYYITKNSWGEISDFKGYLMMSEAFVKLKTVGIMVHKDSVPDSIVDKFRNAN